MDTNSPVFDSSLRTIGFSTDEDENAILGALEDLSLAMNYTAILLDESDVVVLPYYQSAMLRTFSRAAMAIKRDVNSMINSKRPPKSFAPPK
jgi:hypothetical protein